MVGWGQGGGLVGWLDRGMEAGGGVDVTHAAEAKHMCLVPVVLFWALRFYPLVLLLGGKL